MCVSEIISDINDVIVLMCVVLRPWSRVREDNRNKEIRNLWYLVLVNLFFFQVSFVMAKKLSLQDWAMPKQQTKYTANYAQEI